MAGPWIDAHCHLADARFAADLSEVLARSRAAGVTTWVQGGVGPDDWRRQRELQLQIGPGLVRVAGLHPWWASAASDSDIDEALGQLATEIRTVKGLGELGLDHTARRLAAPGAEARQMRAFVAQLEMRDARALPIVLHVVKAHAHVLKVLERFAPLASGGLVHAFSGSREEAGRYLDLGLHLSVGGGLIGREKLAHSLSDLPPDRFVVETDSPDQMPKGWTPARNEPAELPRIADALAPIWRTSGAALLDGARETLERIFGVSV